jgi:hypothetical protein
MGYGLSRLHFRSPARGRCRPYRGDRQRYARTDAGGQAARVCGLLLSLGHSTIVWLEYDEEGLDLLLGPGGFLARTIRPMFRMVSRSWHTYLLGFLFGLRSQGKTRVAWFEILYSITLCEELNLFRSLNLFRRNLSKRNWIQRIGAATFCIKLRNYRVEESFACVCTSVLAAPKKRAC